LSFTSSIQTNIKKSKYEEKEKAKLVQKNKARAANGLVWI
jgi:hypothetical protein